MYVLLFNLSNPFQKIDRAKLHSVDLLAKCQEYDDKELKAWYSFFAASMLADSNRDEALTSFCKVYEGPKIDESTDSELLFHTCVSMAMILSTVSVERSGFAWPFNKPRPSTNAASLATPTLPMAIGHHAVGAQLYDRVSHLLRAGSDPSPLTLCSLARRLLNIYSTNSTRQRMQTVHDAVIGNIDLGRRFANIFNKAVMRKSHDNISTVDDLIESVGANPAVNELLAEALSAAIRSQSGRDLWETLIRLSRLRLKQNEYAQCLLILDDIEEHVFADCGQFEWGLLFKTRSECLLKLASLNLSPMLVDAFQNIQYAIACFDRASSIPNLTRCVHLAVLVSHKLQANPFTNFYSVKASQIRSSMDCNVRFFPIEGQEEEDVHNVMENTGQPKLPFAQLLDRLPGTSAVPASPVGRGMQTLIAWRQH